MHKIYRAYCGKLDQNGFIFHVNRIHTKRYELHLNGTIVKVYKLRQSCNKIIKKKYQEIIAGN